MLSLEEISLQIGTGTDEEDASAARKLLDDVSLRMRRGQLVGVVGPSGCGKSTLLKLIAGLLEPTAGAVRWDGRNLAHEGDLPPHELGYVPQFSLAHDRLTVRECVDYAARLRVAGSDPAARDAHVDALLQTTGLAPLADRQARVLSGGQRRRLSLAIEMVSSPSLLLCDEVTSGLDPGSAHEILTLLHALSRADGGSRRIVVNVTHSLADLPLYDAVLVLYQGVVVYHGSPEYLAHYFRCDAPDQIFARLGKRRPSEWQASWHKHGPEFAALLGDLEPLPAEEAEPRPGPFEGLLAGNRERDDAGQPAAGETPLPPEERMNDDEERTDGDEEKPAAGQEPTVDEEPPGITPSALDQFWVLFERRLRLFTRDRTQLGLQLALILGFPCLVVIFALKGLPAIHNLSLENNLSVVEQLRESASYMAQSFQVGGLVSGLLLFQIILLALMGSNNSALEIAGERPLFESEKLAGLSSGSYVASKAAFLALLVTAQAVWMALFVHAVCRFPGDLFGQIALLWLADAAFTAVCLAFSSLARTPWNAFVVSVYFVGFQLPLSGAVLALPDWAVHVTRPFIAAYWSWAGTIQTLRDTRFYDLIVLTTKTDLAAVPTCFFVLAAHVALGVIVAYFGCRRSAWE